MECQSPNILLEKKILPGRVFGFWGFLAIIKCMEYALVKNDRNMIKQSISDSEIVYQRISLIRK